MKLVSHLLFTATLFAKRAAPMLIVQGTKDPLVPLDQSRRLADRLNAAGAEVTLNVVEGAGHGGPEFTTPESLTAIMEFFARHLAK
ncbi:MAG: prolyl oligopeptidase family serine peptidase [Chthoniobacteraceae bacterium]